mmetsp:Transcript_98960/g.295577  ORF Transcript_98960/g.295577 Transcript_98960/m.295577 type:complete len:206 (+) Transcript_98960:468-1085(+)
MPRTVSAFATKMRRSPLARPSTSSRPRLSAYSEPPSCARGGVPFLRATLFPAKDSSANCSMSWPKPTAARYLQAPVRPFSRRNTTMVSSLTRSGTKTRTVPSSFSMMRAAISRRSIPKRSSWSSSLVGVRQWVMHLGTSTQLPPACGPTCKSSTRAPCWTRTGVCRRATSRRFRHLLARIRVRVLLTLCEFAVAEAHTIWTARLR